MGPMSVEVTAARSTADARELTQAFLDGLVRPIGGEAANTVVLVASAFATNALRHAGGTCTVDLTAHRTASRWPSTTPAGRRRARAPPT